MKRILSVLLLALPIVANALPHTVTWDTYPATATMYVNCAIGTATLSNVGSAPSSSASTGISFDIGDQAGQIVVCVGWTQVGTVQSPLSAEVSVSDPLPAPAIHLR